MRTTMRQLLGGKKSQKPTGDDNRETSALGSETSTNHHNAANGYDVNYHKDQVGTRSPTMKGNPMNNVGDGMMSNGYNNALPGNGFRNDMGMNQANDLATGMENMYANEFHSSMPMGSSMNHGMTNGFGNSMMSTVPLKNDIYGGNMGKSNFPFNNHLDESDALNSMNRDWNSNYAVNHNTLSSNMINPRYDSIPLTQHTSSTIPSRSSPVSAVNTPPNANSFRMENRKVAERSRYVSQMPTSVPQVITGIVGGTTVPGCLNCEDEPIRTPGAIQSVGALIEVLSIDECIGIKFSHVGDLEVRIASENSRKVLGYGPEQLFALGSFYDILEDGIRKEMSLQIDHCLASGKNKNKYSPNFNFFQITLTFPYEPDCHLWCTLHLAPNFENLIICEFEEYSDNYFLKDVDATRAIPQIPHKCTNEEVDVEEYRKSTTRYSKPIVPLSIARQRENKMFSSHDIFCCMNRISNQLSECQDVKQIQDVLVGLISEMTGFHRVMSYRFDNQKNGCVEAEIINPQASSDIFRGLHYPASDIPSQARELYKINPIRILFDRESETSRLVCRDDSDFEQSLDLSYSNLRAISPIHIKYLRNMGVRSSVSISLVVDNELWGLIACHGYGDHGIRLSIPMRELCCGIGECASINIERLMLKERIRSRKLPPSFPSNISPPSGDLLTLVDADFAVLNIGNKTCRIDKTKASQNIKADFPALNTPPGIRIIAGVLIIPLNFGKENDFLVFFRKSQLRSINWAGFSSGLTSSRNPHEKVFNMGSEYLEPRMSFQRYIETVNDTCKEWTEDQPLLYGRFAETWRMKSASTTTKERDREVEKDIYSAPVDDTFNLKASATRVLEALKKEAQRKALDLTISIHDELPTVVIGDADCFKQVMLYFIRNGFRSSQSLKVDVNLIRVQEETHFVELKVQDAGPGMSEEELDEFERAQSNEKWPFPNQGARQTPGDNSRGSVTLSVVATFVRSINGQIQVTSELGKGTIFTVELPYKCAPGINGLATRKPRNVFSTLGTPKSPTMPPTIVVTKMAGNERKEKSENNTPTINVFPQLPPALRSPSKTSPAARPQISSHSKSDDNNSAIANTNAGFDTSISNFRVTESRKDKNTPTQNSGNQIKVLIADNDSSVLRTLETKLSNLGYSVDIAHDGQECHDRFALNLSNVDIILIELKSDQMPVVDGVLATRMIRITEKEYQHRNTSNDSKSVKQRVPIIAISSSFDEENRFDYIQSGFDGWIFKPIDFQRLDLMLKSITEPKARQDALYVPGQLRKGGWFLP